MHTRGGFSLSLMSFGTLSIMLLSTSTSLLLIMLSISELYFKLILFSLKSLISLPAILFVHTTTDEGFKIQFILNCGCIVHRSRKKFFIRSTTHNLRCYYLTKQQLVIQNGSANPAPASITTRNRRLLLGKSKA